MHRSRAVQKRKRCARLACQSSGQCCSPAIAPACFSRASVCTALLSVQRKDLEALLVRSRALANLSAASVPGPGLSRCLSSQSLLFARSKIMVDTEVICICLAVSTVCCRASLLVAAALAACSWPAVACAFGHQLCLASQATRSCASVDLLLFVA